MQKTFRGPQRLLQHYKVIVKKIGKKRATQNISKGDRHMSHKFAQEKSQKKKNQQN